MLAQLQNSVGMQGVVKRKRKAGEVFRPRASFQFTFLSANNNLGVTSQPKPPRQLQQLALPATQTEANVDMSDLQRPRGNHG
jgi:hypothetical protein